MESQGTPSSKGSSERKGKHKRRRDEEIAGMFVRETAVPERRRPGTITTQSRKLSVEEKARRAERERKLKRRRLSTGAGRREGNRGNSSSHVPAPPNELQHEHSQDVTFESPSQSENVLLAFEESEEEDDDDSQSDDSLDSPTPEPNGPPVEPAKPEEYEEDSDENSDSESESGYDTDVVVEDVRKDGDDAEDILERQEAAFLFQHGQLLMTDDLHEEEIQNDDQGRTTDGAEENSDTEAPAVLTDEPLTTATPTDIDNSGSTNATWTPDCRRPPVNGESVSCPQWGHPLFVNRPTMDAADAGRKAIRFRKVAKKMAAGRMRNEEPTERDERHKGYLRRHKLVSSDEPPELVASDSDDDDAVPEESHYPLNFTQELEKDEPSWKALTSIGLLSGYHPLTHTQYEASYHLWEAVVVSQMEGVKEILEDFEANSTATCEGNVAEKCEAIEAALREKVPLFSISRARTLKGEALAKYKIPMFRVNCTDPEDPEAKESLTQARLYSDLIAADLLTPGIGQKLLHPKRVVGEGILPHYYDTDHGRDPVACHRPGAYGVAADACEGKAAEYGPTAIPRLYTNKLFCQGSTLRISMKTGICAVFPRSTELDQSDPRKFSRIKQKELICVPKGDPFVVRADLQSSDISSDPNDQHHPEAIRKLARAGSVCWPVDLLNSSQHLVTHQTLDKTGQTCRKKGNDFIAKHTHHMNAYLCYTMIIDPKEDSDVQAKKTSAPTTAKAKHPSPPHPIPEDLHKKSLIFVRKDQSILRNNFKDSSVGLTNITVLDTPEHWEKGSLRPVEKKPFPNPYTTRLYDADHDGIPIVTIPMRPFEDDCSVSADGKKTAGGLYFDYPSLGQRLRTAIQCIRISGFVTDKTETDALILAMAHDLIILRNQGMIMDTVEGKYRVYVEIPTLSGDWVQCAKSSHSTGHASSAPCGGCTWRRGPKGSVQYATAQGMSDLNYFMNMDRCEAVLELGLKPSNFSHIGVRQNALIDIEAFHDEHCKGVRAFDMTRSKKAPLHALRVLRECTPSIARYDPFLSCWPGPDHLLFLGLGKSSLELLMSVLQKPDRRRFVRLLKMACAESGLTEPFGILRKNQSMKDGYLAQLSVAQIAALLLVAPVALSQLNEEMYSTLDGASERKRSSMRDLRKCRDLLLKLRRIINLIYFAPKTVCDTEDAAKRKMRDSKQLGDLCADYMQSVEQLAVDPLTNPLLRERVKKFCDLPNLHRLFEVCTFWLPAVGYNIAHLAEVMFEKCHQVIKRYYENGSSHENGGYYGMDKINNDETIKRVRIASASEANPPGSVFDFRTSDNLWHLFDKVTPFFAPGHRGNEPALASLMDIRGDRLWMRRGVSKSPTLSAEEMSALCAEMRIPSSCALTELIDAKFGLARESHNIVAPGCVISAITDSLSKATMRSNQPRDMRLRLRSCPLSEELEGQSFGKNQVMVAVHEVWEAQALSDSDLQRKAIMVKGVLLGTDGSISKEDLPIYKATNRECWIRLDKSCRKVLAFPWKPFRQSQGDNIYLGKARLGVSVNRFKKQKYFSIIDHEHGFPSRAG